MHMIALRNTAVKIFVASILREFASQEKSVKCAQTIIRELVDGGHIRRIPISASM